MIFSKACEYGIRAVIYIYSISCQNRKAGIKEISGEIDSPEHFTGKILQELSRRGIISSTKGPHGGFYMDEYQGGITLLDLVEAIDGDRIFKGCGLGLKNCSELEPCPIHYEYARARESMKKMLSKKSVKELSEELDKGETYLARDAAGLAN